MKQRSLLFDLADNISKSIYSITLDFPYKHQSSIGDQLRRASLSIVLNIVEGGTKQSDKEKTQYRRISFGSLKETKYLIYFCYEMKLINDNYYKEIMNKINKLAAILYGLIYRKV
jgi:four helix bundle protein